ncbi:aldehyde dehydrogenase family protein [Litoricolaceae bacterium]|nr:aldehyde dehydrogenase family protein [Litorivicinaceae bacterium]
MNKTLIISDPSNGDTVANVGDMSAKEMHKLLSSMRLVPSDKYQAASRLRKVADSLSENIDEWASLISRESGLSLVDTRYEVARASKVALYASRFSKDSLELSSGEKYQLGDEDSSIDFKICSKPIGLIFAITPFNHPLNQVAHKVLPALAAGASIVVKPSPKTPLSCVKLIELLWSVGFSRHQVNYIVTSEPEEALALALACDMVEMVTFTGSTVIGRSINKQIANSDRWNIKFICELGGNSPLMVFKPSDLRKATEIILNGCFKNSGQRCSAIRRVIVHEKVADTLIEVLLLKLRNFKFGHFSDPDNLMGTQIDCNAADLIRYRVKSAVLQGAKLVHGALSENTAFIGPLVLDHVTPEMEIVALETFGPVCCIIRVASDSEVLACARQDSYGLAAAAVTLDKKWVEKIISGLDVGQINFNAHPGFRFESAPFGGYGDSGNHSKEGVVEAIKSMRKVSSVYFHND